MKPLRVLILAAFALCIAACATTPSVPPAPKGPDLTGQWLLTTESPMGAQDSEMAIKQTGEDLSGQMAGPQGQIDFTGKLIGSDVNFGFPVSVQGMDLKIDYAGTVSGDTMQGKAVFGQFGEGNFTAKRKTP